jgi:beta-galactosidase
LEATIGTKEHTDTFDFSVIPSPAVAPQLGTAAVYDPKGLTTKLLTASGANVPAWDGQKPLDPQATPLVIIGREALTHETPLPAGIQTYVKAGGRVLLMQQQPEYLRSALGFRVSPHVSRQFFTLNASAPVLGPLQTANLRYWRGDSSMLPEFLDTPLSEKKIPFWGWHVSNRHGVSSGAVEKPHRSGWRPLLEGEFDLAYSPLLELDYGSGRVIFTQLDFEDHVQKDPAAALLFANLLKYIVTTPPQPRVPAVLLSGSEPAPAGFTVLGAEFTTSKDLPADASLAVIAPGATIPPDFEKWVEAGGKALVLAQNQPEGILGTQLTHDSIFMSKRQVPEWPEVRGISQSDLRFRNQASVWKLSGGPDLEVSADGLLARRQIGSGVIIFSQLDPTLPEADKRTYLRGTRWRQMRAQSQLLANLGASFAADAAIFQPRKVVEVVKPPTVSLAVPWKLEVVEKRPGALSSDKGYLDPGMSETAKALLGADVFDSSWTTLLMPQSYQTARREWAGINGEVVMRVAFEVPETLQGKDLEVSLGPVDDGDVTYFNGVEIGRLIEDPRGYAKPRVYPIPAKLVKPGRNILAIRVWDRFGDGGFTSGKPEMLLVREPVKPATQVEIDRSPSLYHSDYRADWDLGDDPYRYYNW